MPSTLTVPVLGPTAATAATTDLPTKISSIATTVLDDVLLIAGIVAVFYVIYGGYRYISAGGDPFKVKTAQGTLLSAVIGVAIIVSAFTLVQLAIRAGFILKTGSDSNSAVNTNNSTDQVNNYSTTSQTDPTTGLPTTDGGLPVNVQTDPITGKPITPPIDTRSVQEKFVIVLKQCATLDTHTQIHNTTCRDYFLSEKEDQFNKACADAPELKSSYYYCGFDFTTALQKLKEADANPSL